ncbi:MAG: type III polyketide synthase [bacterium]|nr:type III polyketide synthase [bacterium]
MSVIVSISTAVPSNKHKQTDIATFMSDLYQYSEKDRKRLETMYAKSGIETRYSVIPDFSSTRDKRDFFPSSSDLEPFPDIAYRMKYFSEKALPLCISAIRDCLKDKIDKHRVSHLITVSCTGLSAPGLDIDIVQYLKLNENINRTSLNFMGCYAAVHALKQADYICKSDPLAIVLLVCVELCTLHFQKLADPENIMANLLFADGAAAALVVPDTFAKKNKFGGFRIRKFHSHLALNGKSDMAWKLSPTGFLMTLSAFIPKIIESGVKSLFDKAIDALELKREEITHWAIHPGGRKILEVIQKELSLHKEDLESSYRVLKHHGNMSSPTILFVLKELLETKANLKKRELTFGVAFGPGLTMESLILENV